MADCERLLAEFADEVVLLSSRPDMSLLLGCMAAGARSFVMEGDRPEILSDGDPVRGETPDLSWGNGPSTCSSIGSPPRSARVEHRLAAAGTTTSCACWRREGRRPTSPSGSGSRRRRCATALSQLYRRLGVRSRNAAVRLAEQKGLLDQSDRGRS